MNHTPQYSLPQWEKSDRIVMTDFNGMTEKIEAALTAHDDALAQKADQSTADSLQTQVNQKAAASALSSAVSSLESKINGKLSLTFGSYYGTGGTQRVSLGFSPREVWFQPRSGNNGFSGFAASGFVAPGYPMRSSSGLDIASISGTELVVVSKAEDRIDANRKDTYYHYAAFR